MAISLSVVAAICGNFYQESGVNPGIYEDLEVIPDNEMTNNNYYGGYGLGQWTNKDGTLTRRTGLIDWLNENNYDWDDGYAQLEYLIVEGYWVKNIGSYNTLQEFLETDETDIDKLTKIYMRNWEGVSSKLSTRQKWAKEFYDFINEHYYDAEIHDWIKGNRYLSIDERKHNAVLVARKLQSGIGPKRRRKMPLYMYLRRL